MMPFDARRLPPPTHWPQAALLPYCSSRLDARHIVRHRRAVADEAGRHWPPLATAGHHCWDWPHLELVCSSDVPRCAYARDEHRSADSKRLRSAAACALQSQAALARRALRPASLCASASARWPVARPLGLARVAARPACGCPSCLWLPPSDVPLPTPGAGAFRLPSGARARRAQADTLPTARVSARRSQAVGALVRLGGATHTHGAHKQAAKR